MTDKLLPCPFCGSDAALTSDCNVEHGREIRYWIVRCPKILCDASVGEGCNFSRELAIAKWNTRTRPAYTHRNGATEAPTVPGLYWFKGHCHGMTVKEIIPVIIESEIVCAWRPMFGDGWFEDIEHFSGKWYGPITPPWESEAE